MRNYTQKLSKKERDQLELERESYQQIINEMTPITQEIQANIEDIIPCFNKNQPIIDIQKAEIESTNYATSFVDAQIGLYIKDTNKRNDPYFQAKRNADIFTLMDLYNQILQNKAMADMQIYDLNNAEKRNPRMFEVLTKHQQMRAEILMVKVRLENEMMVNWHNVVATHTTLQQLDEMNEISEGELVEDPNAGSTIATHQAMIKRLKEK